MKHEDAIKTVAIVLSDNGWTVEDAITQEELDSEVYGIEECADHYKIFTQPGFYVRAVIAEG